MIKILYSFPQKTLIEVISVLISVLSTRDTGKQKHIDPHEASFSATKKVARDNSKKTGTEEIQFEKD